MRNDPMRRDRTTIKAGRDRQEGEGQGEFWLRPLGVATNTTLMHRIGTMPSEATEKAKFFG